MGKYNYEKRGHNRLMVMPMSCIVVVDGGHIGYCCCGYRVGGVVVGVGDDDGCVNVKISSQVKIVVKLI